MPSDNNYQVYRQFEQMLQQLQVALSHQTLSISNLKTEIAQLQQLFQLQLVAEPDGGDATSQIRAIQTEISKQMRLLDTDVVFLQAARQSATVQQRKQQMTDRLQLLLRYCSAVLESDS